jgi:prepilin-type N-terminal cleavage/methylation domain-containing protein
MTVIRTIETSRESGFTLLELLVSIVILSLIVTISYSALMVGSRSWQGTANTIKENSTTRFAVEFIRKKIEQLYPIYWQDGVKRVLAFQGEEDGLKFIAPAPQGRETEEYYEYYITAVHEDMDKMSLMLYFEAHDPSEQDFKVSKESPYRKLLSGLTMVRYSYFGTLENSELLDWYNVWSDESKALPMLIKLEMVREDTETEESWLEIVVEPRSQLNLQGAMR